MLLRQMLEAAAHSRIVKRYVSSKIVVAVLATLQVMLPTCRRTYPVLRAVRDEDAELDRITREANQADIWDNEVIGVGVKVRNNWMPVQRHKK